MTTHETRLRLQQTRLDDAEEGGVHHYEREREGVEEGEGRLEVDVELVVGHLSDQEAHVVERARLGLGLLSSRRLQHIKEGQVSAVKRSIGHTHTERDRERTTPLTPTHTHTTRITPQTPKRTPTTNT